MITNNNEGEESELESTKQVGDNVEGEVLEVAAEISLNAISGSSHPSTFKVVGHHYNQSFIILIDYGATYNFIDPSAAEKLNCSLTSTTPMLITVANGEVIQSHMQCDGFKWKMQKQNFSITVRVIPLGGCDVVLSMQWLESLGSVQMDFKQKIMTFQGETGLVTLKGLSNQGTLKTITAKALHKYLRHNPNAICGQLKLITATEIASTLDPTIQVVLDEYKVVFSVPKGLPPPRLHDHHIPLKEGSNPFSRRPYRYPQLQKSKIKKWLRKCWNLG